MEAVARPYVEDLLARGRHTFTREEAEAALGTSPVATYHALRRLLKRGWLAMPRRGFYLIVDPEHRKLGALPATTWIDDLMRFQRAPYYVALLSAAALHGAAHQQPNELQVVTSVVLRPLAVGRVRVRFFFRQRMSRTVTERMKTSSGYFQVSTPETTAFDLVRYRSVGSIDAVATVVSELAERLDAGRLVALARKTDGPAVLQRLGYLLDRTGHEELTAGLSLLVERQKPKFALLEPRSTDEVAERNERWRLDINTSIEVET